MLGIKSKSVAIAMVFKCAFSLWVKKARRKKSRRSEFQTDRLG